jgi:hypothetical protein
MLTGNVLYDHNLIPSSERNVSLHSYVHNGCWKRKINWKTKEEMVSTDFGAGTGLNLMHNSMMMMTTRTHRP